MYECLTGEQPGAKCEDYTGCINADDMGMGKTLMSVTTVWTLLMQGREYGRPTCNKVLRLLCMIVLSNNHTESYSLSCIVWMQALILCPSSLVGNWVNEFHKWVGAHRINVLPAITDAPQKIDEFRRMPNM